LYDDRVADATQISALLQDQLHSMGLEEVAAVEAALWLDAAGLLPDSRSRPGLPLRKLLREGNIRQAEQRPAAPNGRWFIVRERSSSLSEEGGGRRSTLRTGLATVVPAVSHSAQHAENQPPAKLDGVDVRAPSIKQAEGFASEFTRSALIASGFLGFVNFKRVVLNGVPDGPGVYVVLRESSARPVFLSSSPAGWFKGQNPTVPVQELKYAWPEGVHCVYIGKANNLRKRIKQFRQYGDGRPVGHQGGRRIWQLADADCFVLAWLPTPYTDPELVEGWLLRGFVARHGKRPIGNRTSGRI
jgi:hypothetical protein